MMDEGDVSVTVAWQLESFLIPKKQWRAHKGKLQSIMPKKYFDDFFVHTPQYPMGLGHHNEIGYFMLILGHVPYVEWTEKDWNDVLKVWRKHGYELSNRLAYA
jgi:hypothetical protein